MLRRFGNSDQQAAFLGCVSFEDFKKYQIRRP